MKIGLNTYSFRNEIEKTRTLTLEKVCKIAKKIGFIEGIELLDRHIPGWPNGDIKKGIKETHELVESFGYQIYALGPHLKLYQESNENVIKEIAEFKRWINFAAENGIPNIRTQVAGPFGFFAKRRVDNGVKVVSKILDDVLHYAEQQHVKIGIETHWKYSSYPPFLDKISMKYKDSPSLGIIFDWGNFHTNEARYQALEIASRPYNHSYNHVKIYQFGENFQEINYDSYRIVQTFKKNNFKDFFSIEFEGKQPTIEGVYKSVHALQYAITDGAHKIIQNPDLSELQI